MATSGTIGTTVIDTSKVIEHALRRCRVKPALQTSEVVATAKENLFLLLAGPLATQGLNLWCVETQLIGLKAGQATYDMPIGTIDVLNIVYSQPRQITTTDTIGVNLVQAVGDGSSAIRVGVKASAVTATATWSIETSTDGIVWNVNSTVTRQDWTTDTWHWFQLDPASVGPYFRVVASAATTFSNIYVASSVYDLPLSQWSRDTFSVINEKTKQGHPATNYYLERHVTPRVTLWPVPDNDADHLTLYRHRQIQDVGALTQELEIPPRWFEPIVWQLASRLCFELDMVEAAMIPNIVQMADKVLTEVENDETDGAPLQLRPNIGVYSR